MAQMLVLPPPRAMRFSEEAGSEKQRSKSLVACRAASVAPRQLLRGFTVGHSCAALYNNTHHARNPTSMHVLPRRRFIIIRWPALAGPGLAGDCWFVVPVRFCDWARGLDGVYLLTRRELFALQPRPLCCRFRLVTVVVVTKSRLPKVGSPTLGSVVVRRKAGTGYPKTAVSWCYL